MKKLVLIAAAIATVISFSACKKTCICTPYVGGKTEEKTEYELPEDLKKCSEMSTIVEVNGVKTGLDCK